MLSVLVGVIDPFSILGILAAAGLGLATLRKQQRPAQRPASARPENTGRGTFAPVPGNDIRVVDFGSFPVAAWLRKHGWTHHDGVYRGEFVAGKHRLRGEVHYRAGAFEILMHEPPISFVRGDHWACWRERPDGWQLLHLNESPNNVVEAIVGCQAFLLRKLEENAA